MTGALAPALRELLEPLERFERIRRGVVGLGPRLCDLSYANPGDGVEAPVRRVLEETLRTPRHCAFQYSPFGGHSLPRRAVAESLEESHGLPFSFSDVVLTPGATSALRIALRAVAEPGDEVLVPVPCWHDYPLYVRHLGFEPVTVPLSEPGFDLDVAALEAAATSRTCAILLSNPANPTGRSYPPEALERLAEALRRCEARHGRRLAWISDEAHRDLVPAGTFHSPAAVWPDTLIVHSFGKYHGVQGQRAGYVAVSPRHPERRELSRALPRWTRITGLHGPTALMQWAIPGLLSLRHDLSALWRRRDRIGAALEAGGYEVPAAEGTFFLYPATPPGVGDFAFVEALARAGVLVLPAPVFHHTGHFRISLTAPEERLEKGLRVLREARSPGRSEDPSAPRGRTVRRPGPRPGGER